MHTDFHNRGRKKAGTHTQAEKAPAHSNEEKMSKYPSIFKKILEWGEVRGMGRRERIPFFFRVTNSAVRGNTLQQIYCCFSEHILPVICDDPLHSFFTALHVI